MQDLSSFLVVVALWLGASVALWWVHREGLRRKRRRQREFVAQIWSKVRAAQAIYDGIRQDGDEWGKSPQTTSVDTVSNPGNAAPMTADGREDDPAFTLRSRTTMLLRRVQEAGPYFDSVRALHPGLQRLLEIEKCAPLAEILQIRRDIWAASEIILIDDVNALGDAFAEAGSYERFCEDARRLLFKGQAEEAGEDDLIDLRLSVARTDVETFAAGIEEDILAAEERERFPTPAEIISYPVAVARAAPGQWRVFRAYAGESIDHIRLAARNLRESQTVAEALGELRRAREEFPGLVNASLEKAAALARNGRESIVAHQHLLLKAYDLQAKYQEALQRAPELSDRGRQFVARLELKKRSEQLRETSRGVLDDGKRIAVRGLAHLIAALQSLQERLAVPEPQPAGGRTPAMRPYQQQILTRDRAETPRATAPLQPQTLPKSVTEQVKPRPLKPRPGSSGAEPEKVPPTKSGAKSIVYQEPDEQPSPETLDRLSALFGGRGRAAKPQTASSARKIVTPPLEENVKHMPSSGSSSVQARAKTTPSAGSIESPRASTRRLWPALDKLRSVEATPERGPAHQTAQPAKTPSPQPLPRKTSTTEDKPKPVAPEKAKAEKKSLGPRRMLFGTRKQPEADIIPPMGLKSRQRGAGGDQIERPGEGSIAEMLQRLRLADAELLEVEAFGAPLPERPKPPSLLSKLSTVSASPFDTAEVLEKTQPAKAPPVISPQKPVKTAPLAQTAPPDPKKPGGFSLFRRNKA